MTGSTKVVVELTADEDRLLQGFRKAEAADRALRTGLAETGAVGDRSGKAIADAMLKASSTVTRTTNQMLAELRKAGPEGSKIFGRMAGDLVDFEQAGRKSIDTILDRLEKVDPMVAAMAAAAREELASLDKADRFEKTRQSIAALGGDFAVLGKEIKKATDAPLENADAAAKRMVEELLRIDPTKAQQIAKALDNASEAINASRLDEFVKKLGSGSKEAQALSRALGDDMKVASLEAEGGIDGISKKILALRPDLKSTVDQWRMEMAEAAKFGEGQYEKALDALREGGPVSKKVADKIKQELVASGKIVEKTFEDMIKPLEQIDPESAAQARKMQANFQMMEENGKGAFSGIRNVAVAELTQIVTAYVGVQEAIQFVTQLIQDQQTVLKEAAEGHRTLAVSQQEAFKNLSTLPENVQKDLLESFVPQIARQEGFSDLANLTKAVGDARSAGASVEELKEAVQAAAALNGLTTEFVDETAAALVDAARATGNVNARQNASQLFVIGSESRIVDPQKLFRNVSPVQIAGSVVAGEARKREGALEGGAIFAALSRVGADQQGDASQTATIQFMSRMSQFFKGLGKDASEAEAELAKLQKADPLSAQQRLEMNRLSTNEGAKGATDKRISDLSDAIARIQGMQDVGFANADESKRASVEKRKLKEALAEARGFEFSESDSARLQDLRAKLGEADRKFQEEKAKLEGTIAAAKIKNFEGRIPQTPAEQLQTLQSNAALSAAFMADKFGEQRFRPGFEQLVTGGEAFRDFQRTRSLLAENQGSDELYQQKVNQSRYGTKQLEQAYFQRIAETSKNLKDAFDSSSSALSTLRTQTATALKNSRSGGIQSFFQGIDEIGTESGVTLGGSTTTEEGVAALFKLTERASDIRSGGVSQLERPKLNILTDAIENTLRIMESPQIQADGESVLRRQAERASRIAGTIRGGDYRAVAPSSRAAMAGNPEVFFRLEEILQRQLILMEQQQETNKRTEQNTRPSRTRSGNAQATAAAANNGRAGQ